jgi:iron-sulfur cluster assembly protein
MVLDYEQTLMRQGFVFNNPNATKSCGCGSSFS